MNTGVEHAKGDILLFLHPDTILPKGAIEKIIQVMDNKKIIGGGFYMNFDVQTPFLKLVSLISNFRMRIRKIIYGDQTLFVKKEIFEAIGKFKDMGIFEDLEISKRLRKKGKMAFIKSSVITSSRRFIRVGTIKQWMINQKVKMGYLLGVSPDKLKKIYNQEK